MKKRINAGIKSMEEARECLEKGEKFFTVDGNRLYYDKSMIFSGNSPYRLDSIALRCIWNDFATWQKEIEVEKLDWSEILAIKPRLCRVWDNATPPRGKIVRVIKKCVNRTYYPDNGGPYQHAELLSDEEIKEFLSGEEYENPEK